MDNIDALKSFSDDELLRRLSDVLARSRRVEWVLVAHIAEVDARRLYAREGSPSMFRYCLDALHLSESEAYRRIAAARVSRSYPVVLEMLEDGRLHLARTVAVLRNWLKQRGATPSDPLFPSRRGAVLSRDAVERLVKKHAATACENCPTLLNKNVTPHVLRHTSAVQLLQAGNDRSVIALWLGHESVETTQIYLDADLAMKERAINKTAPPNTTPGRFRPPDHLLAFLETL